ncbi:hypothetical protein WJX72_000417 [[Myrmecia] bisecta]|uniref:Uncharacterized protein n=1 Tax=[Myrmecia] bisecta TaxID=41462 RepID=A0AAW1QNV3_9CHLO
MFHGKIPVSQTHEEKGTAGNIKGCSLKNIEDIRADTEREKRWEDLELEGTSELWHLAPFLKEASAEVMHDLLEKAAPHIVFHVRGGDKYREDQAEKRLSTHPEHLVATFKSQHPSVKGGTCLLIGDDHALINRTRALVQSHVQCEVLLRSMVVGTKHEQDDFNRLPLEQRCAATHRLIVDLSVMGQAEYFVGSPTSGIWQTT